MCCMEIQRFTWSCLLCALYYSKPGGTYLMEVICFTTSWGECRSMRRLWILHNSSVLLNPCKPVQYLLTSNFQPFKAAADLCVKRHSPHLETIPGVSSFATWRLAGSDLEDLGGQAHGPLDLKIFIFCSLQKNLADCKRTRSELYFSLIHSSWICCACEAHPSPGF